MDGTDLTALCIFLTGSDPNCLLNSSKPSYFAYSMDRNGNYWQLYCSQYNNCSYLLTDTLGRQGMLNSNGQPRSYTTTNASIPVSTNFGQTGVAEYSQTFSVVQSLTLPDGSTYTFKYDCDSSTGNPACGSPSGQTGYYGLLVSVTLPTTGTVNFGYTSFTDSFGNKRRWLTSHTSSTGTWTYSPSVISTCGSGGYGCQQKVTVMAPDYSKKVYTYTLNNGAWPVQEQFYDTTGSLLATINNTFDFSNSCGSLYSGCAGAAYIRLLTAQIAVPGPGGTLTKQIKYQYDSKELGDVTAVQEWGFQPGTNPSFSSTPDKATYTSYVIIGNNIHRPQSVTVCNNSGSDSACTGGGGKVAQTLYTYDSYGANCPSGGLASANAVNHYDSWYGVGNTVRGNLTYIKGFVTGSTYATTQLCYDITGQVTARIDPNGNTTQFSYADNFYQDASPATNPPSPYTGTTTNAYPTVITLPIIGASKLGYYYGSGKIAFSVDQNGADTYFHYLDSLDRLTHTFLPVTNGNRGWTLTTYSSNETQTDSYSSINDTAPSTSCTSCVHNVQTLDAFARPLQSTLASDPGGPTYTVVSYDSSGRTHTVTNPYRSTSDATYGVTTLSYDGFARPTVVTEPDNSKIYLYYGASVTGGGGISSQLCAPTTYGYGYPMLQIDEAGKKKQTWANAFGQTIEVDEPNSSGTLSLGTCYAYDALGNLTSVVQMGGTTDTTQWRTRTFAYDGLSRLLSATEPESGTTTYTYDNNGNVLTKTAPAPNQTGTATVTTTYTYDALNRLTYEKFSDGTYRGGWAYDQATSFFGNAVSNPIGRVTTSWEAYGGKDYSYDTMGRVKLVNEYVNSSVVNKLHQTSYTYDLAGDVTKIQYPSGRMVTYGYSAAARPISATDSNGTQYVSNVTYWPSGSQYQRWTPSPVIYSRSDLNNRLQPSRFYADNGVTTAYYLDKIYSYTAAQNNGNVMSITNNKDNTRTQNFTYDPLNRLATAQTQTTGVTIPNSNCWGLTFGYDPWGNLLTSSTTGPSGCSEPLPLNVAVATSNRISTYSVAGTVTNYCFDAAGNLIHTVTAPATCPASGPYQYAYDAGNMLNAVSGYVYKYDSSGLRFQKWQNGAGVKGYWYGAGSDVLAEGDVKGNITNEYVFLNGERIARVDSSNNVVYYLADHLGSAREVVSSSATILDDSDFYPFGGERPSCEPNGAPGCTLPPGSGNTYKFTGYERDSESDLDYASARHFSSTIGRFMSPDLLSGSPGNPQSWNRYSYVYNNPLNATDPSGMCSQEDGWTGCDWDTGGDSNGNYYSATLCYGCDSGYTNYGDQFTGWWADEFYGSAPPNQSVVDSWWTTLENNIADATQWFLRALGLVTGGTSNIPSAAISMARGNFGDTRGDLFAAVPFDAAIGPAVRFLRPGLSEQLAMQGIEATEGATATLDGSFSIIDWSGYPGGVRPSGPFRILQGSEYDAALEAKNAANNALHRSLGLKGFDIHEIQPVKFGGSPTAMSNKIVLDPATHSQYTTWWAKLLRDLLGR